MCIFCDQAQIQLQKGDDFFAGVDGDAEDGASKRKKVILICGQTGAGKTSFLEFALDGVLKRKKEQVEKGNSGNSSSVSSVGRGGIGVIQNEFPLDPEVLGGTSVVDSTTANSLQNVQKRKQLNVKEIRLKHATSSSGFPIKHIVLDESKAQVVSLENGCACCGIRMDVLEALKEFILMEKDQSPKEEGQKDGQKEKQEKDPSTKDSIEIKSEEEIDTIFIECNSASHLVPIIQTLFHPTIASFFLLDSVICVVDAPAFLAGTSTAATSAEKENIFEEDLLTAMAAQNKPMAASASTEEDEDWLMCSEADAAADATTAVGVGGAATGRGGFAIGGAAPKKPTVNALSGLNTVQRNAEFRKFKQKLTFREQLALADVVLLNKVDLLGTSNAKAKREAIMQTLNARMGGWLEKNVSILACRNGLVNLDQVLNRSPVNRILRENANNRESGKNGASGESEEKEKDSNLKKAKEIVSNNSPRSLLTPLGSEGFLFSSNSTVDKNKVDHIFNLVKNPPPPASTASSSLISSGNKSEGYKFYAVSCQNSTSSSVSDPVNDPIDLLKFRSWFANLYMKFAKQIILRAAGVLLVQDGGGFGGNFGSQGGIRYTCLVQGIGSHIEMDTLDVDMAGQSQSGGYEGKKGTGKYLISS